MKSFCSRTSEPPGDQSTWYIENYGDDWFGLKSTVSGTRGIPEGTESQWRTVIRAMRGGYSCYDHRLSWAHESFAKAGEPEHPFICSPRNTNEKEEFLVPDPIIGAGVIEALLNRALKVK